MPERLAANRHVRFGGPVAFGWLSNDFGPGGYIGDPTAATAERGKHLFEGAVRAFGDALVEIAALRPAWLTTRPRASGARATAKRKEHATSAPRTGRLRSP